MTPLRHVAMIALLLPSATVYADAGIVHLCVPGDLMCEMAPRQYSGDGDLSRAMTICEQHSHDSGFVYPEGGSPPRVYERDWAVCNAIRQKWNEGEEAKAIRERVEQENRDKAFVEDFAKQLTK